MWFDQIMISHGDDQEWWSWHWAMMMMWSHDHDYVTGACGAMIDWYIDCMIDWLIDDQFFDEYVDPWSCGSMIIDRSIDWLIDWLKLCSSFHYFSFFHSFLFLFSFLIRMIIYPHVLHWFDISSKFNGGSLFIPWNGKGLLNFVLRFFKVHYFSGNFNGYVNFFWNF